MHDFEKVSWGFSIQNDDVVWWKIAFLQVALNYKEGVVDYHISKFQNIPKFNLVINYHNGVIDYHSWFYKKYSVWQLRFNGDQLRFKDYFAFLCRSLRGISKQSRWYIMNLNVYH